jgi:hypothetical protein
VSIVGLGLTNNSLQGIYYRVAKMYIDKIFLEVNFKINQNNVI